MRKVHAELDYGNELVCITQRTHNTLVAHVSNDVAWQLSTLLVALEPVTCIWCRRVLIDACVVRDAIVFA